MRAMTLADEKYVLLTTFRRSGEGVANPVWIVPTDDGRLGFWTAMGTGKTKRLTHTPRVTLQASDARGRAVAGSVPVEGTAEMVRSGPLFDEVHMKVKAKYGAMVPFTKLAGRLFGQRKAGQTYADTVVLVRLASPS